DPRAGPRSAPSARCLGSRRDRGRVLARSCRRQVRTAVRTTRRHQTMCGITAIFDRSQRDLRPLVGAMTDTLRHRGPDDEGAWQSEEGHVALGHRRLSIVDLSPLGRNPMASSDGRYWITYNGEVYNFRALR